LARVRKVETRELTMGKAGGVTIAKRRRVAGAMR
jgi:hypothetical protein